MNGFSILVCTYNGAAKIKTTIDYLFKLKKNHFEYEIIIIDNNSTDNTFNLVSQIIQESPDINIKIIPEYKIGKVNALITGVKNSVYKYLVICDDDNWLSSDYLTTAYQIMECKDEIGVLGGRGIIHTNGLLPTWFDSLKNCWAVGQQSPFSGEIATAMPTVWGAGMVVRKKVWDLLPEKGFCGFLTGRSGSRVTMTGEDSELCVIVNLLGFKIYYENTMTYFHEIHYSRLNWNYLLKLWKGFSRSQIYFSIYINCWNMVADQNINFRALWYKEVKNNFIQFFSGYNTLNFYKGLYIAFIENREGYLYGLEKRKYLTKIFELFRIRNEYINHCCNVSKFLINVKNKFY